MNEQLTLWPEAPADAFCGPLTLNQTKRLACVKAGALIYDGCGWHDASRGVHTDWTLSPECLDLVTSRNGRRVLTAAGEAYTAAWKDEDDE